jgi:hypothetical protein
MEVERDNPDAPLAHGDRLMLETMQNVYRQLERRPRWSAGEGITRDGCSREEILQDWMRLVRDVREEVESATIFNDEISVSDWPDISTCLILGTQAFLEGKAPTTPPSTGVVETWKLVCRFLIMDLIEQRQLLMQGYLKDFIKRQKANNRIGPAFDAGPSIRPGAFS